MAQKRAIPYKMAIDRLPLSGIADCWPGVGPSRITAEQCRARAKFAQSMGKKPSLRRIWPLLFNKSGGYRPDRLDRAGGGRVPLPAQLRAGHSGVKLEQVHSRAIEAELSAKPW